MDPDEQQLQPGALEQGNDGAPTGEGTGNDQPSYQRVTPEEAATLPYAELKRRMKQEAQLAEDGLLETTSAPESTGEEDETATTADATGQRDSRGQQRSGGNTQGGDLSALLAQATQRAETLERERAEERAAQVREKAERERQETLAQHRRVEEHIASLPAREQEIARRDYVSRLGQQAVNEYYGLLQQRETAVRQAELQQARIQIPNLLNELADDVATRHGIKADRLKDYVGSQQFRDLLGAAHSEEAMTAVAANAGQLMEFIATQEEARLTQEREKRRQAAVANPRVRRDTPAGGVPTAGGDTNLATRIQNMSSAEFMAWKKQQLRLAQDQRGF